ncbi:hypothetical protein ACET3Z_029486 [Daucus carota]
MNPRENSFEFSVGRDENGDIRRRSNWFASECNNSSKPKLLSASNLHLIPNPRNHNRMSSFKLNKKLLSATKAWNKFTKKIQAKTTNLNISKSIKLATSHLLSLYHKTTLKFLNRQRRRNLTNLYVRNSPSAAIYVDKLFSESTSKSLHKEKEKATGSSTSRSSSNGAKLENTNMKISKFGKRGVNNEFDVDEAWKKVVSSSASPLRVDERAEEFISKFRQEMEIQREQSILDYQEMLARGL